MNLWQDRTELHDMRLNLTLAGYPASLGFPIMPYTLAPTPPSLFLPPGYLWNIDIANWPGSTTFFSQNQNGHSKEFA